MHQRLLLLLRLLLLAGRLLGQRLAALRADCNDRSMESKGNVPE